MLAVLLETPSTNEDWTRWAFHHEQDHREINQAIRALGGSAPDANIYPMIQEDLLDWMTRHQQLHVAMDSFLGTQSTDLQLADLNDPKQLQAWTYSNYLEHQTARKSLGI